MSAPDDERLLIDRLADQAVTGHGTVSHPIEGSLPVRDDDPVEVLSVDDHFVRLPRSQAEVLYPQAYGKVTVPRALVDNQGPSVVDVVRERLREALKDEAFTFDHPDPVGGIEVLPESADDFRKNQIAVRVSREMALDMGIVEPTDEERAARDAQAAEHAEASARRRAEPGPPLTLDALLEMLGWEAAYAAHRLHPECHCSTEDWYLCDFAQAQGFTYDDLGRTP